jgi:biopolymer transport protein ExbD
MAFRRRKRGDADIPVASFSDLAFLLIIFFILVTSLDTTKGFKADLPAGEKGEAKQGKTTTVVLRDDRVVINDADVSMAQLKEKLVGMALPSRQDEEERVVLLEAVGNVTYQNYYEAMSIIHAAGGLVAIVRQDEEGGGN